MKITKKKPVAEEVVMEVVEEDGPYARPEVEVEDDVYSEDEPMTKATRSKKPERRIVLLSELSDDAVYGLHGSCLRAFGTEHRPALGSEIKKNWARSQDYGIIRYYAPTPGLTPTGTLHNAPKGDFLVKFPDGFFVAAENYMGSYTPEKEGCRRAFHFHPLTKAEQRALTLRTKKAIAEREAQVKKSKKKLRFKFN